jgi:hypothetical protein
MENETAIFVRIEGIRTNARAWKRVGSEEAAEMEEEGKRSW